MGQAKQRGSFQERCDQAIKSENLVREFIDNHKFDLCVRDEDHSAFGAETNDSVFQSLNAANYIYNTATAQLEDASAECYNLICSFGVLDAFKLARKELEELESKFSGKRLAKEISKSRYASLPKLQYLIYHLVDLAREYAEESGLSGEELKKLTTIGKIKSAHYLNNSGKPEDARFVYEDIIGPILMRLFKWGLNFGKSQNRGKNFLDPDIHRKIIIFFDQHVECEAFVNFCQNSACQPGGNKFPYRIVKEWGSYNHSKYQLNRILEHDENGDHDHNVIIVSCGKDSEGINLRSLDTVVFFCSNSSSITAIQRMFRGFRRYSYVDRDGNIVNKRMFTVIDMDSTRAFKILPELARSAVKKGQSMNSVFRSLLDVVETSMYDVNRLVNVDLSLMFEKMNEIASAKNEIELCIGNLDFDDSLVKDVIGTEIAANRPKHKTGSGSKGKTYKSKITQSDVDDAEKLLGNNEKEKKEKVFTIINQSQALSAIYAEEGLISFYDLLDRMSDNEIKLAYSCSRKNLITLYSLGAFRTKEKSGSMFYNIDRIISMKVDAALGFLPE